MRVDSLVSSPGCLTLSLRCVIKFYKDPVPNSVSTTDRGFTTNSSIMVSHRILYGHNYHCKFITNLFQLSRHLSTNCYGLFIEIVSALSASDINNCFKVCKGLLTNLVAARLLLYRNIHKDELVTNEACLYYTVYKV